MNKILLCIAILILLLISLYFVTRNKQKTNSIETFQDSITILNNANISSLLNVEGSPDKVLTKIIDDQSKIVKITDIPRGSYDNVTTLDLSNNDIRYLNILSIFRSLPGLQVLDLTGNNNYIGFKKNIFLNNSKLQRIVINEPSFYTSNNKKLYITIENDDDIPSNVTLENIRITLSLPTNPVICYRNPSYVPTTTPASTTTPSSTSSSPSTTTPSSTSSSPSTTTQSMTGSSPTTTQSLMGSSPTTSMMGSSPTTSMMGSSPTTYMMGSSPTTSSLESGLEPCSSYDDDRDQCYAALHCTYDETSTPPKCELKCNMASLDKCGTSGVGYDYTRCRVNCNECEYNDGTPTNTVCNISDCSEYSVENCPSSVCKVSPSIVPPGMSISQMCIRKDCDELDSTQCGLLFNDDGTQTCEYNDTDGCRLRETFEPFTTSQYIDYSEDQISSVFEIIYNDDLLYGINTKSNQCKINTNCLNNECLNKKQECINNGGENCDNLENNCESCFDVFKKYNDLNTQEIYYENEINRLRETRNPNYIQLINENIKNKNIVNSKKAQYINILKNKGILDNNGNIVVHETISDSKDCKELKKLLQSYSLNNNCKNENGIEKCICNNIFDNQGRIIRRCQENTDNCIAHTYNCPYDSNTIDNSKDFCLPYNMNETNLTIEQERNKLLNVIQNYNMHECLDNTINNGKL